MHFREESDSDGPGNTVFAWMTCLTCGIRSREVIAFKEEKAELIAEWTPNTELRRAGHLRNNKQTGATPCRLE
jgi:hypothetical protein